MENLELPSIGACMLAGIGNGIFQDAEDAAAKMVKGVEYFYPQEANRKKYEDKYRRYKDISAVYLHG